LSSLAARRGRESWRAGSRGVLASAAAQAVARWVPRWVPRLAERWIPRRVPLSVPLLALALLASCASHGPAPASSRSSAALSGLGGPDLNEDRIIATQKLTAVSWGSVPGWQDDALIGALPALRANCARVGGEARWRSACAAAAGLDELDPTAVRSFFEWYFAPYQLANSDGSVDGLITGYYEPLLRGSRSRRAPFLYPLYRWPDAYARGDTLPPRAQLMHGGALNGDELVYVDDPIEAFFLQVQGSGRITLDDGSVMRVGVGGTNNQPYKSIGRWLIDHGQLTPSQATMQGIRAWARDNPRRVDSLLDVNPRFVFFRELSMQMPGGGLDDGPIGALGVPLTSERSIAVDPAAIPLGTPVFLSTTRPMTTQPLNRLVFAQDVGSAIKGTVRADYFWGFGDDAGDLAGHMKQRGRMWLLLPRS
jgi:membrane-bound lytic murein transglycosylase A